MPVVADWQKLSRFAWDLFPKDKYAGLVRRLAEARLAKPLRKPALSTFSRIYGIDAAEVPRPLDEYASVAAFFTRELRAGARPVDDSPDAVVSSADGRVVDAGTLAQGVRIEAKRMSFSVEDLLAAPDGASEYAGGTYCVTYLSPRDYHRVHAPIDGEIVGWRHVPGTLFPVNDASVERDARLFAKNERLVMLARAPGLGNFAVVMVAAVGVGNMSATFIDGFRTHEPFVPLTQGSKVRDEDLPTPFRFAKGDELGTFHLGSTTVLVFGPNVVDFAALSPGATVKMGERIGSLTRSVVEGA